MNEMKVYVLFRFSKKTGRIDTTMTGATPAMMKLWALSKTTKTKRTIIIKQDTGNIIFDACGTENFPKIKENVGNCENYGISLALVKSIVDDRF